MPRRELVRKVAVMAAVVITGFLAGWSSQGVAAGTVMAVALGAGAAWAVFRGDSRACAPRRRA
ncbi:MAG: hypothetical protein M0Z30_17370 [Actinomycetota bacterium]|nr:hypothetical protein [Actinomycetota bacterium]